MKMAAPTSDIHIATGEGGLECVHVRHSSGATATVRSASNIIFPRHRTASFVASSRWLQVYLHGAHMTSCKTSAGQELLFVSSRAIFDGVKPIRGGIPIAFPQFAAQGPLPMHGFARTSKWTPVMVGDGMAEFTLSHSDATLALWPHHFTLHYRIQFDDNKLTTSLDIINPHSAPGPFSFEALLHTYFFVGHDGLEHVQLSGLKGTRYISKPEGNAEKDETDDAIRFTKEVDRVYMNTPADLTLEGITSGEGLARKFTKLHIHRQGSVRDEAPRMRMGAMHAPLDVVVWNAGKERCAAIADFGADDYKHYVCVEPGRVSSATADFPHHKALVADKKYTLTQTIKWEYE